MNNCKYCKADCALRGEENLKECKGHIHMSNADRIRSMNDEELAKFLECFGLCHYCTEHHRLGDLRIYSDEKCDEKCAEHCSEWLQQPAENPKEEM